ncbi:hypothetical protein SAMN04488082_10583 [Desulfomicrobium apsheronum]|jgi:hypothetical protein|uniref:Uncharacterized protein n=1 Tax=Desulfomicrobium apsheronum TaxID=52560 RepID=A0A1I3T5A7_9BACT|nr:hypothetical protein [Desulfomicrobium apsheronum]SFJ65810.1 hypothetical protein SAMN04488082_10583 [Desulfomicrobium apsheronum]
MQFDRLQRFRRSAGQPWGFRSVFLLGAGLGKDAFIATTLSAFLGVHYSRKVLTTGVI